MILALVATSVAFGGVVAADGHVASVSDGTAVDENDSTNASATAPEYEPTDPDVSENGTFEAEDETFSGEIEQRARRGTQTIDGNSAELLEIETNSSDATFTFGGNASTAFGIVDASTNESVTVTPRADEPTYVGDSATFYLYDGTGVIDDDRTTVSVFDLERGNEHVDVDVTGDTDMFETGETYSPYVIELVDAEADTVLSSTDERVTGVGYEESLEPDEIRGEVDVSIARDDDIDPSWNVTFELYDGSETLFETDVDNEADAENFEVTVDTSDLESGEYGWELRVDKPGQDLPVKETGSYNGFVVDVLFDHAPADPELGENVTFDASAATSVLGEAEAYEWDFGDGTTAEGDVVTHSYDEIDTYETELTVVDASGETRVMNETVPVGGHVPIEQVLSTVLHVDEGAGYGGVPAVRAEKGGDTFTIGGDGVRTFRIHDDAGESVNVTLEDGVERSVRTVMLDIYDENGSIDADPAVKWWEILQEPGRADVSVEGDTEMFETADPVSTYTIELVDDWGRTVETTDERAHVMDYEGSVDWQMSDDGLEVSIPRDDVVEDDWEVEFEAWGDGTTESISEDVPNDPDKDRFSVTIDPEALETGAVDANFAFDDPSTGDMLIFLLDNRILDPDGPLEIDDTYQPRDVTGADDLYEDVDGSGSLGSNDVVTFFEHLESDAIQDNAEYFDFNDSGSAGFDDVIALFERV